MIVLSNRAELNWVLGIQSSAPFFIISLIESWSSSEVIATMGVSLISFTNFLSVSWYLLSGNDKSANMRSYLFVRINCCACWKLLAVSRDVFILFDSDKRSIMRSICDLLSSIRSVLILLVIMVYPPVCRTFFCVI